MKPHTPQNPRFPGIVDFARHINRSRLHVYFVLRGVRQSPFIHREWKKFQATRKNAAK